MNVRALLVGAALIAVALTVRAQSEVHGSSDVYADRDVALVWAVLRGATDADTAVVIRVSANAKTYRSLAVVGINPFTKAAQPLQPPIELEAIVDIRVPRGPFAELPRTELRFYATAADARSGAPKLTVYYLGVPDTTPEFVDRAKLDAYLSERLTRARSEKGTR